MIICHVRIGCNLCICGTNFGGPNSIFFCISVFGHLLHAAFPFSHTGFPPIQVEEADIHPACPGSSWMNRAAISVQTCLLVTNLFAQKRRYIQYQRAGIFPFFPRYFAKTAQDMFCEPLTPKSFWKQRQSICTNSKPAGSSG